MANRKAVTLATLRKHKDNPCAVLACPNCGGSYSANPSDYFFLPDNQPMRCQCVSPGVLLRLIHREVRECELT